MHEYLENRRGGEQLRSHQAERRFVGAESVQGRTTGHSERKRNRTVLAFDKPLAGNCQIFDSRNRGTDEFELPSESGLPFELVLRDSSHVEPRKGGVDDCDLVHHLSLRAATSDRSLRLIGQRRRSRRDIDLGTASQPHSRKLLSGANEDRDCDIEWQSQNLSATLILVEQRSPFPKRDLVESRDLQFNRSHEFSPTILKQILAPRRIRTNPLEMADDDASDGRPRIAAVPQSRGNALLVVSQAFEIKCASDLLLAAEMVIDAPNADSRPLADVIQRGFGESLVSEALKGGL